ncbi:MAG: S-layer homology domain-containing protein [Anaerovoracaceae bacterium]
MKRMKRYAKNLYRFLPVSLAAVLCAVSFVCAAEIPGGNAGQDGISQAVHWYDEYVACATERGWIGLLEDGTFGAEEPMTRAVFVSALYQMKQETEGAESMPAGETDLSPKPGGQSEEDGAEQSSPPVPAKDLFGDVTGDEWFVPALEWAAEQKIINGIDGDFCPDQTINRETMAVMIRRAASVLSISSPSDWSISIDYTDLAEVSDWAVDGIAFCAVYEIMSGNPDGSFAPKRELTRAEAAAVLQRVDGLRQKAAAPDEKETAEERKNVTERIS